MLRAEEFDPEPTVVIETWVAVVVVVVRLDPEAAELVTRRIATSRTPTMTVAIIALDETNTPRGLLEFNFFQSLPMI